jgi:hypothetical protein
MSGQATSIGSVFVGISPQHVRNVMHEYVRATIKNFDKYIFPSCGSFTTAQVICRAGVDPKKVITSDVSLYTTALGQFIMGKTLDKLGIVMENIPFDMEQYDNTRDKLAELFLAMRYDMNLREKSYYFKQITKELVINKKTYHANICKQLDEMYQIMHGLKYATRDMKEEVDTYADDERCLIFASPPRGQKDAYTKMFDFKNIIWNNPKIPEMSDKDFADYYSKYLPKKATIISEEWGDYESPKGWNKLSAEDKNDEQTERLLINKKIPEDFMKRKKMGEVHPKYKMYNDEPITKKSVIKLTKIKQDEAFYYRDMFIHKLGATGADITVAFTIDNNLLAVTGLTPQFLYGVPSTGKNSDGRLHEKDYIFQIYGLTVPSLRYKRLGRLLAYFITCREFKENLEQLEPSLQMVNMTSIRSSALTPAPEQKLVHGLMKRISKDRMPNQMFKLVYTTEFHDRSYKECIIRWLDELRRDEQLKKKLLEESHE